jgi:NADH dehydrogenase (ubiquinone) 1 beta subcomplex subunit 6
MTEPTSRPMSIKGPYENERARLDGTFTDVDREWRKKWLKAQELGHHEPRTQFSASQMEMNPIRRAYRFPLDFVFSKLQSRLVSNLEYLHNYSPILL